MINNSITSYHVCTPWMVNHKSELLLSFTWLWVFWLPKAEGFLAFNINIQHLNSSIYISNPVFSQGNQPSYHKSNTADCWWTLSPTLFVQSKSPSVVCSVYVRMYVLCCHIKFYKSELFKFKLANSYLCYLCYKYCYFFICNAHSTGGTVGSLIERELTCIIGWIPNVCAV